ncbi:MAG TPA: PAS domain S-box protein, partial [Desulfobacteria bacterium]|nr:PAS domain S-box protein [Desulfobacteria bacterium]
MVGTKKQWLAFYPEERPILADFVVDEQPEGVITSFYADKYQKSELIEGAYEALDFFPSLKDGGKWLFFSATPLRDSKGHSTGALETLQDVTGLKSAEEALRESEAKYRGLAENLQDGLFILQGYPYPELKFCNEAFAKMVGYTAEEMMALTIQRYVAPENLEMVADSYRRRLDGEDVPREYEYRVL